jgi:FHA domain
VPAFDELRAVVAEGDGVVARFPGLLAVAAGPDAEVRRLLELCRESAGPSPGRALARRLAAWLSGDDAPPDALRFGTVAVTDRGIAVFLRGGVDLLVPDRGTAMAGADAATWTDRLIEVPDAPMALTLQGATAPADPLGGVLDLREGVVPGVAVVAAAATMSPAQPVLPVQPGRAGQPARADGARAEGSTGEHQAVVPPPAEPAAVVEGVTEVLGQRPRHRLDTGAQPVPGSPAAARAALRAGVARAEEREKAEREKAARAPEKAAPEKAPVERPPADEPPKAEGYLCARGHLNDPRSHVCVLCGIRMNEHMGVLVVDERPPLGMLVFDDGATHTVDAGYLLGREPDGDARVRSGVLRPIALDDPSGAMSRVHAEIRLDNWDVLLTDSGSSNGTFIAEPGMQVWSMLAPSQSFRLVPGVRVRLGQRTFTFETPSGVR